MAAVALIAVDASPAPTDDRGWFNATYVSAFLLILATALVAEVLRLEWRAWFPGAEGDKSLIRGVSGAVCSLMSIL